VDKGGDVEWLDLRELVNLFRSAPVGKAAGGVNISSSRMGVVDLRREKLEEAARGFSRRREQSLELDAGAAFPGVGTLRLKTTDWTAYHDIHLRTLIKMITLS
jgi:hypothetical protein